jgi:SAM-dependent methyltransferase
MKPHGAGPLAFDPKTLHYYQRDAKTYGARRGPVEYPPLMRFVESLPSRASVLELGCGGGQDAEVLLRAGLDVTLTDGSPAMADFAARRLERPVLVLRFDELEYVSTFDGVWANACLLHAPEAALPDIIARIYGALRPEGLFCATFKGGAAGAQDTLGRYFNYMSADALGALIRNAAPWRDVEVEQSFGLDFLGAATDWLVCCARA